MIIYKNPANAILLICLPLFVLGQNEHCHNNKEDSTKCYVLKQYIKPQIKLERKWESKEIASTYQVPIVADMDSDCIPEILLRGFNTLEGSIVDTPRVHFYDGRNGNLKTKFDCKGFQSELTPVISDLDDDGINEIIMASYYGSFPFKGRITCYDFYGNMKWLSDEYFYNTNHELSPNFGVADFNNDGKAEVYCTNRIFNGQTGKLLAQGGSNGVGAHDEGYIRCPSVTVAAQLDDEPNDLELAAGFSIYKIKLANLNGQFGNQMIPINLKVDNDYYDGKTAVADINLDGQLDVIVSHGNQGIKSKLYVYTLINGAPFLIAQNYIPGVNNPNGCPTISDIDGNGIPNILVSKHNLIHNFEYDGSNILKLKWSLAVRDTYAVTGITTFDFNGDGISEIIYRDHSNLFVLDGSVNPPQFINNIKCLALTGMEYPIIADIDLSGKAQICIVCAYPGQVFQQFGYLTAFGSPDSLPGWAPARGIWNQYAYNPLFINDDLTVPAKPKYHATYENGKYNNFMQQESLLDSNGMYKVAAASLWGKINCVHYDFLTEEYTVSFNLFNQNSASSRAESNLPVSFYKGDPSLDGNLVGIFYTTQVLNPGDSLQGLQIKFNLSQLNDLFMVVNTKRDTIGPFDPKDFVALECDYTDNYYHTTDLPQIEKRSATICNGSEYLFYDSTLNVQGRYIHTSSSVKGCDSLITILELTIEDTVHTSQSHTACDSLHWNAKVYHKSGTFVDRFQSSSGCDSVVTLNLSVRHSSDTLIHKTACRKFDFNDKVYTEGGHYFIKLRNRQGCDSTIELNLSIVPLDTNVTKLNNTLTALDSLAAYQWVDCDDYFAPIVDATQKSYTPVKSGNYGVILSSPPCSDTTVCIQVIVTHAFNENNHPCLIYPNPATSKLYVQFPDNVTGDVILTIYDVHGRELFNRALAIGERELIDMDVSSLVEGVYSLIIQSALVSDRFIFYKVGKLK